MTQITEPATGMTNEEFLVHEITRIQERMRELILDDLNGTLTKSEARSAITGTIRICRSARKRVTATSLNGDEK